MNYRHAFHAGNAADVLKHAVLARILLHLKRKDAPFRVLDTHAGAGLYDLSAPEAQRTGEWRAGIGRLLAAPLSEPARDLLRPYLDAVAATRAEQGPVSYPGSPEIARRMLRPQDRLIAVEQATAPFEALRRGFGRDPRAKAVQLDGWTALNAFLPPKERRGLVLIDPPYEQAAEFETVAGHLLAALRKWATGIFAVWYPIADAALAARFAVRLSAAGVGNAVRLELITDPAPGRTGLKGSGMVVVNPPHTLADDLAVLLPALAAALGRDGGSFKLDRLGEARTR